MKIFFLLLMSFTASAVEVALIEDSKNKQEVMISFTDESLQSALDKTLLTQPCKTRFVALGVLRETYVPRSCRAEVIKFILNSGYKPLEGSDRVFSK